MRKISIFTGNRAEYGLLRPFIAELVKREARFQVELIVSGSHLNQRYGMSADEIEREGLSSVSAISLEEKSTEAEAISLIIQEGSRILDANSPDILVVAGDRFETYAISIAAFYKNIPLAHIFGGDISEGGHWDDSVRHSITKLAHIHFTSNADSFRRVGLLGEESWRIHNVGSTAVDNMKYGDLASVEEIQNQLQVDVKKPLLLFTQHPVVSEVEDAYGQARESLSALESSGLQTIITYPNADSGSEDIIRAIHEFEHVPHFRIRRNLGWRMYLGCMKVCSAVIGNSSSGLLETPYFKVPCVNIGTRQTGRLRAQNVIDVGYSRDKIMEAIQTSIFDLEFQKKVQACENPYGNGNASGRMADLLENLPDRKKLLHKKMTY